ncbi:MAG: hypothetical protein CMM49_10075 [Rhodospirillaceae bacterium]|nr:hypothetical protein [Rhodospirillaceae bacterium]|tara:strand:+ start:11257 stop:11841 length:585 start_codon:yes stop_codon:yes gene_type:complete
MNKKNKKNILDDSNLWEYVMSETKIIPKKKLYKKNNIKYENKMVLENSLTDHNKKVQPYHQNIFPTFEKKLNKLEYSSMDKSLMRKLKKGELIIDKTLDLHCLNQNEAYKSLSKFIENNFKLGRRYLLVITGKGNHSDLDTNEQNTSSRGILRSSLPIWLDEEKFKKKIITHKKAFNRHGGEGARYIILRKNKI